MYQARFDQVDIIDPASQDEKDRVKATYGAKKIKLGKEARIARGKKRQKDKKEVENLKKERAKAFRAAEKRAEASHQAFLRKELNNSSRAIRGLPPE